MSAELMKSQFVRRLSSVVRPFVRVAIISDPYAQISFKFGCCFPWAIRSDVFWNLNFKKNVYEYFSFSLTWDLMGAKISKRYSSYKSQSDVFKLFLNFRPNGPHKTTFGSLKFWKLKFYWFFFFFFRFSLTWDPKTEWNLAFVGSSSTYMGYLWPCSVQCHFRSFGAISIFHNLGLMITDRRKHFECI